MHDNFLDGGQEFSFNYNPIKPETAFPGVMPSAENDITLLQNPKHQCRELHAASLSKTLHTSSDMYQIIKLFLQSDSIQ